MDIDLVNNLFNDQNMTPIAKSKTEFENDLNVLVKSIQDHARSQFIYNFTSNVKAGILKIEDCAEHALNQGLVSAISARNQWDINKTIQFAIDVLEDSNCHFEASLLLNQKEN